MVIQNNEQTMFSFATAIRFFDLILTKTH